MPTFSLPFLSLTSPRSVWPSWSRGAFTTTTHPNDACTMAPSPAECAKRLNKPSDVTRLLPVLLYCYCLLLLVLLLLRLLLPRLLRRRPPPRILYPMLERETCPNRCFTGSASNCARERAPWSGAGRNHAVALMSSASDGTKPCSASASWTENTWNACPPACLPAFLPACLPVDLPLCLPACLPLLC